MQELITTSPMMHSRNPDKSAEAHKKNGEDRKGQFNQQERAKPNKTQAKQKKHQPQIPVLLSSSFVRNLTI